MGPPAITRNFRSVAANLCFDIKRPVCLVKYTKNGVHVSDGDMKYFCTFLKARLLAGSFVLCVRVLHVLLCIVSILFVCFCLLGSDSLTPSLSLFSPALPSCRMYEKPSLFNPSALVLSGKQPPLNMQQLQERAAAIPPMVSFHSNYNPHSSLRYAERLGGGLRVQSMSYVDHHPHHQVSPDRTHPPPPPPPPII